MKIIDPGHIYELRQLGDDSTQIIKFIKRSGGSVHYDQEWSGLQSQEVLRALIDRTKYLYDILPCKETTEAIRHLQIALYWYEVRALRRKRSETNRTTLNHDDSNTTTELFNYPSDIPFTEIDIELRPIGSDGHIIL
ncbi:MAG TPA: hypothetical protein PKZ56_00770 [Candidatus Paceibacterota bacterium]|nr:hypothetical protein [Candidatus Paceibacterota bacterium]